MRENIVYINEFLDYLRLEKGSSEKTIQSYKVDLKNFFSNIDIDYDKVEKEDIYKYIEHLKEKYRYNSVQRKISSLKSFYKFLYVNKYVKKDPTNTVKALKKKKRLPDILTEDELQKIINTFNHESENIRDRLILELLIATGARISEIIGLEIKDIEDSEYRYIKVLGKGSKYRYIPIHNEIAEKIKKYIENERINLISKNKTYKLFPKSSREKFYKTIKEHAKLANIEKRVHPHMIRHTVATILLKNGADIRTVQEILGHSGITTTEIYTHVEKSKLKSIYDKVRLGDNDEE